MPFQVLTVSLGEEFAPYTADNIANLTITIAGIYNSIYMRVSYAVVTCSFHIPIFLV